MILLFFGGCVGGGTPPPPVEYYTLEYSPPIMGDLFQLDDAIKVERFSADQAINGNAMLYREEPYTLNAYRYHRWRVDPGDLITDYLLRDLRNSGFFRAVFSYREPESARYILEGHVVEFLEARDKGGTTALITLNVTLMDMDQKEVPKRILFQKNYQSAQPFNGKKPANLARAMSGAVEKLSGKLIVDIHAAVKALKKE
jgi:ABC-type uncharacterized transport system auxiliary subunit